MTNEDLLEKNLLESEKDGRIFEFWNNPFCRLGSREYLTLTCIGTLRTWGQTPTINPALEKLRKEGCMFKAGLMSRQPQLYSKILFQKQLWRGWAERQRQKD